MKKYAGKIYWVTAKVKGSQLLPIEANQKVEYSDLDKIVVEKDHIQFETEVFPSEEIENFATPYLINLKAKNHDSSTFQGGFSKKENDMLISEDLVCEVFSNSKGIILHGQWYEKNKIYLFWANLSLS
jgi:DNA polymerase III alpha subunit (gram-positive type)